MARPAFSRMTVLKSSSTRSARFLQEGKVLSLNFPDFAVLTKDSRMGIRDPGSGYGRLLSEFGSLIVSGTFGC